MKTGVCVYHFRCQSSFNPQDVMRQINVHIS